MNADARIIESVERSIRCQSRVFVALAIALWSSAQHTMAGDIGPRPESADPSLLFTELVLKPGETSSHTLRLVRATFHDGTLSDREELYTGDASEFGYQSQHWLIDNRYVVFKYSTVFDLVEKKIVHSFDGQVLAVEGPLVYFYSTRTTGEQGVFCFSTATAKREKVANLGEGRWGLRGVVSPSGAKAIVRVPKPGGRLAGDEMPYTAFLEQVGAARDSLGEFAATCGTTGGGSIPDDPPGVWLDDDRFLTQTTLGKVVMINTAKKSRETVVGIPPTYKPGQKQWDGGAGAIDFTPLGLQQPRFSLLTDGRVVYEGDLVYFIDVEKKTWEKAKWRPLGHGFEYSAYPETIVGTDQIKKPVAVALQHDGKLIGTSETVWWATPAKPTVVTTDGYLAVIERTLEPGKVVPRDAVCVWSAATGQWQTIYVWADSLVGWVK